MTRPSLHWSTILLAAAVVMLAVALYWSTRPAHPRPPVPTVTGCRPVNERTWAGGIESC